MYTMSPMLMVSILAASIIPLSGAEIGVPESKPGIGGLFEFSPTTGKQVVALAQALLRPDDYPLKPNNLTFFERELVAAYVSKHNKCDFCFNSHKAFAVALKCHSEPGVSEILENPASSSAISEKLKKLLVLSHCVQKDEDTSESIASARAAGADDRDIHDTVQIAAFFCMNNRYVKALKAWTPTDPEYYAERAERLIAQGYTSKEKA